MPQICRFCLESITKHSSDLTDYRDGFPISVIAMILLPIEVNSDEKNLTQKVCSNCLETLLKAFRLRKISLESDRKLKEGLEDSIKVTRSRSSNQFTEDPASTENDHQIMIKFEPNIESDYFGEYEETSQNIPSPPSPSWSEAYDDITPQINESKKVEENYSSDLHIIPKTNNSKKSCSKVWSFFGSLMNGQNEPVGFNNCYYCILCLNNEKLTKYQYHSSTSSFMRHLESAHNITKDCEVFEKGITEIAKNRKKSFDDEKDDPSFTLSSPVKSQKKVKIIQELEEIYSPDLYIEFDEKSRKSSLVWNYFGKLMKSNVQVGSNDYVYCKQCLEKGKISKYRTTTATSSLAFHLESAHGIKKEGEFVSNEKKEKTFQQRKSAGGSSRVCSECGLVVSNLTVLKRHMEIHGEKSYACRL